MMLNKSLILATLAAALATPVLADTAVVNQVSPGVAMHAKILGVDATQFTASELSRLDLARQEGDSVTEREILNKTFQSGAASGHVFDSSVLSSNDN